MTAQRSRNAGPWPKKSAQPARNLSLDLIHHERPEPQIIMDELESALLKDGWPVPMTPYYLVHHQQVLKLLDRLRMSLREEQDERFIRSFRSGTDPY